MGILLFILFIFVTFTLLIIGRRGRKRVLDRLIRIKRANDLDKSHNSSNKAAIKFSSSFRDSEKTTNSLPTRSKKTFSGYSSRYEGNWSGYDSNVHRPHHYEMVDGRRKRVYDDE